MTKCISLLFNRMNECIRKTFIKEDNSYHSQEDETTTLKSPSIKILQKSTSNDYCPHGNYKKMENYDLFQKFLKKPLVKIYIEEIFLPNKEIKSFQIAKIKGIYGQIKGLLNELNKKFGLEKKNNLNFEKFIK